MTKVSINPHPAYDYSIAIVQGRLEEFISKINAQPDCSIFVRNERSDPFLLWHPEIWEGGKTVKQ